MSDHAAFRRVEDAVRAGQYHDFRKGNRLHEAGSLPWTLAA